MSTVEERIGAGDLFALTYDEIAHERPTAAALDRWKTNPHYQRGRDDITGNLGADATLPSMTLATSSAHRFGMAQALDDVLSRAGAKTPARSDEPAVKQLRRLFERSGRLNERTDGAVLTKRVAPGRPHSGPHSLRDAFFTLRVDQQTWTKVEFTLVPRALDHSATRSRILEVTALPLLATKHDITLEIEVNDADRAMYLIRPNPSLQERLDQAADALRGADLGLIPESTLDQDIMTAWQERAGSLPTWMLIGTGPTIPTGNYSARGQLPPNRAVLLSGRTGDVLASQDKQRGFTISADMYATYNVPHTCTHDALDEGIEEGTRLTVVESRTGRYAILICEDLTRMVELGPTLLAVGVTHLLIPILAPPIVPWHWQDTASSALATETGASTLVFNSVALGRHLTVNADGHAGDEGDGDGAGAAPIGRTASAGSTAAPEERIVPAPTLVRVNSHPHAWGSDVDRYHNPDSDDMTDLQDALTPRRTKIGAC